MSRGRITLYQEDQVYLKLALDLAASKKYPPLKYRDLDPDQRKNLALAITLNPQSLDAYHNGGAKITCLQTSLTLICNYIGEAGWASFVEKNKQQHEAGLSAVETEDVESIQPEAAADHTPPLGMAKPSEVTSTAQAPDKKRSPIRIWIAVAVLIAYVIGIVVVTKKVSHAPIEARVVTSAVTFVLEKPVVIDKIEAASYIRTDSALLYGGAFLNQIKSRMTAMAGDEPLSLESLSIPAGVRVTMEKPVKSQLFIKMVAVDTAAVIEGQISKFASLSLNKKDTLPASAITNHSSAISFQAHLKKDGIFELMLVNTSSYSIPWLTINNILFREKGNFHDIHASSAIVGGSISFPETADSVKLHAFDDLTVTLSNPIIMTMVPRDEVIHVRFAGDVSQLSVGSEVSRKPARNLMPRLYAVIYASLPLLAWTVILSSISFLVKIIMEERKQVLEERKQLLGKNTLKLLILGLLSLSAFHTDAQISNEESYRANAVTISSLKEDGSGFICSKTSDSVFIISAYHVVKNTENKFEVMLADRRRFPGRILFSDPSHDLVVIGIRVQNFKWAPVTFATNATRGERVFYITLLEPDKPLLPAAAIATIDKRDSSTGFQYASIRGVTGGDSGSALLCENGIAGIILTQQVKALDIVVAKDLINAWDKAKWQLIGNP